MKELRDVLEVNLGDIPTKAIDNEKNGFYLFVKGNISERVKEAERKVKQSNITARYYFPLIKKDLAMFVFYKLHDFSSERNKQSPKSQDDWDGYYCITKQFLPNSELCEEVNEITSICMLICNEGKVTEVAYDPNYLLKEYEEIRRQEILTNKNFHRTNTTFSSFEYRAKF